MDAASCTAIDETTRAVAAAMARHLPELPQLGEATLARVAASVAAAPPMTDRQRRRLGPLIFGGTQ